MSKDVSSKKKKSKLNKSLHSFTHRKFLKPKEKQTNKMVFISVMEQFFFVLKDGYASHCADNLAPSMLNEDK